jgi:C1A family cysteine protease
MKEGPVKEIQKEIKKQNASWKAADTELLRLSKDKKLRRLGYIENKEALRKSRSRPRVDIVKLMAQSRGLKPSDFFTEQSFGMIKDAFFNPPITLTTIVDWRNRNGQNYVTGIRDQSFCGACVSFASIATLESMLLIERGITGDLSEAELFFCGGGDCDLGWQVDEAISYLMNQGVSRESCFPYPAFLDDNLACNTCDNRLPVRISSEVQLWDINQRKEYLRNVGPMIGCFDVYEDFMSYAGGIYSHVWGDYVGGHCVEVIGYQEGPTTTSPKFWICKNSWGTNPNVWGDGTGYFHIRQGECAIDSISYGSGEKHHNPFIGISGTLTSMLLIPDKVWKREFKWDIVQKLIDELKSEE